MQTYTIYVRIYWLLIFVVYVKVLANIYRICYNRIYDYNFCSPVKFIGSE